jgi:hypothetical protein
MKRIRSEGRNVLVLALWVMWAAPVAAQVPDHLECYKVRDPLRLEAIVDLNSEQFGTETGCKLTRTSLFCVPGTKAVLSAEDRKTGAPITPLSFWAPAQPGDVVCYKARCPRPFPEDQQITDQFGTRTLERLKPSLLCTPAVKGPAPNADQFRSFPATGQVTCWNTAGTQIPCAGTGHDGDIQAGSTLAYVDNGDGTITDLNTGLTWEKKSDDGTIHDMDTLYSWDAAFAVHAAGLNSASFAGHTDWRVPNAKELQSIVNYEIINPSVSPVFNSGCLPGCSVLTCSCTKAADHWSSTTKVDVPVNAWRVDFHEGFVRAAADKTFGNFVRAVRGGA